MHHQESQDGEEMTDDYTQLVSGYRVLAQLLEANVAEAQKYADEFYIMWRIIASNGWISALPRFTVGDGLCDKELNIIINSFTIRMDREREIRDSLVNSDSEGHNILKQVVPSLMEAQSEVIALQCDSNECCPDREEQSPMIVFPASQPVQQKPVIVEPVRKEKRVDSMTPSPPTTSLSTSPTLSSSSHSQPPTTNRINIKSKFPSQFSTLFSSPFTSPYSTPIRSNHHIYNGRSSSPFHRHISIQPALCHHPPDPITWLRQSEWPPPLSTSIAA